ncbi:Plasmodium exported protein, unknown function [Plasmodium gonderi]|uniref:Stevor n=1 Tax=Plasmodium gonderi TaxID=77519 RepID=A0A1Y1JJG2_PLAGO|nr:Plasmodium exported protein, unknown function [Plasmodium gonderi]GAW81555.1 Plasmodium exported protein, unknown function [Plasmodium gonderi]
MCTRFIKILIFILIYIFLYSDNISSANYSEENKKQDVIIDSSYRTTLDQANRETKSLLCKEGEESKKLKEYFHDHNADTNKLSLNNIQDVLFGDDASRQCILNVLKQLILGKPQIIEKLFKNFVKALINNKQIQESKLIELKEFLSSNDHLKSENVLKALKDNLVDNPFIKELMSNELEDILLGSKLNNEYILKVLKKNLLSDTLIGLSMLKELENIILQNKLVNESKLRDLKKILLSNEPITESQLDELKSLLSVIIQGHSNLKGTVPVPKVNYSNRREIKRKPILLEKNDFEHKFEAKEKYESLHKNNFIKEDDVLRLHRKQLQKDDDINKIGMTKTNEIGEKNEYLKKGGFKQESDLFKLYESIKRDEVNDRSNILKKDVFIDKIETSKINEATEIDSMKKCGQTYENNLFKLHDPLNEYVPAKKDDITKKFELLQNEDHIIKDEAFIKRKVSQGDVLTRKRSVIEKGKLQIKDDFVSVNRRIREKDKSLKKNDSANRGDAINKKKLFRKDGTMNTVDITRKRTILKNDDIRSTADVIPKRKSLDKNDSSNKGNIIYKRKTARKDDSLNTVDVVPKINKLRKDDSLSSVDAIAREKPMRKDDFMSSVDVIRKKKLSRIDNSLSSIDATSKKKTLRKDDIMSSVDVIRKKKLSRIDNSLSSIDATSRKKPLRKGEIMSSVDVIRKKKLSGKDDSLSSVNATFKEKPLRKGEIMSSVDVIRKKKLPGKDDSLSSVDVISKGKPPKKGEIMSSVDVIRKKKLPGKDDSLSSVDATSKEKPLEEVNSVPLNNKRDKNAKKEHEDSGYSSMNGDRISKAVLPEKDSSMEEIYLESKNSLHTKFHSMEKSYVSKKKELLSVSDSKNIDNLKKRRKSLIEDNSKSEVYIKSDSDIHKNVHPMKKGEFISKDVPVKHREILREDKLLSEDDSVKKSETTDDPKLVIDDSSMDKSNKSESVKLLKNNNFAIISNILNRNKMLEDEILKNKVYLTCAKSLHKKIQFINKSGLLNNYRLPPKEDPEDSIYIIDQNSLYRKINSLNNDDLIDKCKLSTSEDYKNKLYITCKHRLFNIIHAEKKELEEVDEVLRKKDPPKEKELIKEDTLPKKKKCTIYIYMTDKKKDKDPETLEKDWVIYKHIKDNNVKVELLKDIDTMTKIDVAAVDSVYRKTEETLVKNVINPPKVANKPRNVKEIVKKVAMHGIPATLAVIAIPFLAVKHIEVSGKDIFMEAGAAALSTGTNAMQSFAPELGAYAGQCVGEAFGSVLEALETGNIWSMFTSFSQRAALCTSKIAMKTASVAIKAASKAVDTSIEVGTEHALIQITFPLLIGICVIIIIEVLYQIFLYLDNRGKLDFIDDCKRKFRRYVIKKKYNLNRPKINLENYNY